MIVIHQVTLKFKWEIKDYTHYKFTIDKKLYNCKTMRQIKPTVIGVTRGYCINGKFKSLKSLRPDIQLINRSIIPF